MPGDQAPKGHGRRPAAALIATLLLSAAAALDGERSMALTRVSRHGRADLLEVCCTSTSVLSEAVEQAGGEAIRASFWNGYDLASRRGQERLLQLAATRRPRHVWFSPPCDP